MTSKPKRRAEPAQTGSIGPDVERALRMAARGGGLGRGIGLARLDTPETDDMSPLFRHLPVPAYAVDAQSGRILAVNDAALAFYGHARDAFLGLSLRDLAPARDQARCDAEALGEASVTAGPWPSVHVTSAGEVAGSTHLRPMTYLGRPALLMTVTTQPAEVLPADVRPADARPVEVQRQAAEVAVANPPPAVTPPAARPASARLPDREQFRRTVEAALSGGARYDEQAAMLCLHVDGLAAIDRSLGQAAGDIVRQQACERLRTILRGHDMLAEIGGDGFAVLQASVDSPASCKALATLIIDEVGAPYAIEGRRVRLGISVGIARAPADGRDPDTLLHKAELALGRARTAGRGSVRFFDPCMSRARCVAADA